MFIRETMILRESLCRPSLHRAEDLFILGMTISLESQRHRSRRLADALSIPTIPSDARAFQRFLFHFEKRQQLYVYHHLLDVGNGISLIS